VLEREHSLTLVSLPPARFASGTEVRGGAGEGGLDADGRGGEEARADDRGPFEEPPTIELILIVVEVG
jgi:hypothetical protein